jgi:hypothetical protein
MAYGVDKPIAFSDNGQPEVNTNGKECGDGVDFARWLNSRLCRPGREDLSGDLASHDGR